MNARSVRQSRVQIRMHFVKLAVDRFGDVDCRGFQLRLIGETGGGLFELPISFDVDLRRTVDQNFGYLVVRQILLDRGQKQYQK